VFLRDPLPQDLQVEIEQLTSDEAMKTARILAQWLVRLTLVKWMAAVRCNG
jgi:hypothetical protein